MRSKISAWAVIFQSATALSSSYDPVGQVRFWQNQDHDHDHDQAVISQIPNQTGAGFANLPFVNCFRDADDGTLYDIAILGAPHDTTTTGRPGARFGPSAIRAGSSQKAFGMSVYTNRNALDDWASVVDCGDADLTWLDNRVALKSLETAHRKISGRPSKSADKSSAPRIVTLGGDHTTTLAALRATEKHWGAVSVIHFDSHLDTWDPKKLGGGISDYAALNHGTFLHFAHEENLILNSSVHAGIRSSVMDKADMRHDHDCGFHVVTARDIDHFGIKGVIDRLRHRVCDSRIYISIDIDVLDPAFAPATGTPEPGGWSSRELLTILAGLEGLELIGGDVVEVSPPYDNNAGTTALVAAQLAHALIELMVLTPVKV